MKFLFQVLSALLLFSFAYSSSDKLCNLQKEVIDKAFLSYKPISKFTFTNDTKASVQVTWAGENSGKIILVTTNEFNLLFTFADLSDVYFSKDNGKSFSKITDKLPVKNVIVRKDNGLQRNNVNNHNIFLVCHNTTERSSLLITEDGGENWKQGNLDFILDQEIEFHPANKLWLLTSNKKGNLYKSMDGGYSWKHVLSDVQQFQWSTEKKDSGDIFAKVGKLTIFEKYVMQNILPKSYSLQKSNDFGDTWKTIKTNIFGFILREKFLYVSEVISGSNRRLSVSIDYGKTFNKVYLPTITSTQFYSIVDIDNDLVFIHVDNEDNHGDGTLFTSDSEGRVFSQSLKNHFYPSSKMKSDFYKVESMRGTYIASQLNQDKSIQSLITFNRGAEWQHLRKPENESCHNKTKTDCYLQVSGMFSKMSDVDAFLPVSSPTAVGLILVHGHLANSLKTSRSDIYVSSDGGYNWIKALEGPHECVIADHGGLLVAIGENKKIIKFSTDEGRCWHDYPYTTDDIQVTGLLTEPGNKAMTVLVWGYDKSLFRWIIHVIDLSELLKRECNSSDYENWFSHSEMLHPFGDKYIGCLLGKKEVFQRLKKDSLCKNGYSHKINKTKEICPCTEDDYECEYGYFRTVNSKICVKNTLITENMCVKGSMEKIITQGYKKIPSDVCEGGFLPDKTKQKMLNETCEDVKEHGTKDDNTVVPILHDKNVNVNTLKQADVKHPSNNILAISICSVLLFILVLFLAFIISRKKRNIKIRTPRFNYKILTKLGDDDELLIRNEVGYESTSPSKNCKIKSEKGSNDSDEDMIG